jgi:hypothetical protein
MACGHSQHVDWFARYLGPGARAQAAGWLQAIKPGFACRPGRYGPGVEMGLAMTILMVAMMVLMVGAMVWGALAARGSRLLSALSRKGGRHGRVDDRHAAGLPPASG